MMTVLISQWPTFFKCIVKITVEIFLPEKFSLRLSTHFTQVSTKYFAGRTLVNLFKNGFTFYQMSYHQESKSKLVFQTKIFGKYPQTSQRGANFWSLNCKPYALCIWWSALKVSKKPGNRSVGIINPCEVSILQAVLVL